MELPRLRIKTRKDPCAAQTQAEAARKSRHGKSMRGNHTMRRPTGMISFAPVSHGVPSQFPSH